MRSERINFLPAVIATAGLMGFIGVFADWFSVSYQVSGTRVTIEYFGTVDETGSLALAAGLGALVFGCAYILLEDPAIRRITALLMVISSFLLLVVSMIGFTRVEEAIGREPFLPGIEGGATFTATVAVGLGLSLVSGLLATVASVLLVSRRESGTEEKSEAGSV